MRTVLIAHQDARFASALAEAVQSAGYRAITCPGPWPPASRCIRCEVGYCPLTEGADLLVYDPDLVGADAEGRAHNLAVETARAHQDVPLLLAWTGPGEPTSVAAILGSAPSTRRAAREVGQLVEQVQQLLGPPGGPAVRYRAA